MSGRLRIRFAEDMPPMAVEVVAPDATLVQRLMLGPQEESTLDVPSEGSFLRLYFPSGKTVILQDPGNLDRFVSLASLRTPKSSQKFGAALGFPQFEDDVLRAGGDFADRNAISRYFAKREAVSDIPEPPDHASIGFKSLQYSLGSWGTASIFDASGQPVSGSGHLSGREAVWESGKGEGSEKEPFELSLQMHSGAEARIRIPGNFRSIVARADRLRAEGSITYSIRVLSANPVADTVFNYLGRSELMAASAMSEWAERAEFLLQSKVRDPFAAALGAYLLLKLGQFDSMHQWAKNLADWFEYLPDGCVIWAWQLIRTDPTREQEIDQYLRKAAMRGLPVYSQGLRLLLDGLKLSGPGQAKTFEDLENTAGQVIWEAPLTTQVLPAGLGGPSSDPESLPERIDLQAASAA